MGQVKVKDANSSAGNRLTPAGILLILAITAVAFATLWMVLPRAVEPTEPPSLTLDSNRVEDALEADRRLASEVPKGEPVRRLAQLLQAQNRAEAGAGEPPGTAAARRHSIREAAERVSETHGEKALLAMRARDVERLGATLAPDDREALLGSFPRMLDRYGLSVAGRTIAPHFVVRTLFKARWNVLVGRDTGFAFRDIEEQAYWGWLSLHASKADPELRLMALSRYEAAGGRRIAEARAVLSYLEGRPQEAARWMSDAIETEGGLRLRNHGLYLLSGGQ